MHLTAPRFMKPDESGWNEARATWNLAGDHHPAAVVYVDDAVAVAGAVEFARANGLRVCAQGTGHGVGARPPLDGTLLIRTERMNAVDVDPVARVGRFEAGAIWREAGDAAAAHGLAVPSGSSPDVGIVGYTTGGGYGWLARRYGLACNRVRAIEIVTGDGRFRRVDADHDADLFWALRGGGSGFGIVTAIEFHLIDLPKVFAGSVIYPADERAGQIFHRYREWAAGVPDEITSIARFLRLPPLPQVPEPLRDRPLITLGACYAGPEADGAELLAPLRDLGEPVMDLFETMSPAQLVDVHMEPDEPVPALVYTASLGAAPPEAIDAFVEAAGPGSGSPLVLAELRQAGGTLAAAPAGAGACPCLEGEFVFLGVGIPASPEMTRPINDHIDAICEALRPWSTGRRYFNFADRPTDPEALFDAATLARLREVKQRYDADDIFISQGLETTRDRA
jgi:FAD/FMN-containing dehydrogenase